MSRMLSKAHLPLFLQLCRFGVVGVLAAIVHFSIVVLLVQNADLAPLIANIFGFIIAFQVSYWGHRLWTFNGTITLHRVAIAKLFFVQVVNFVLNESLFYLFLIVGLPYPIALLIVLAILPVFTFALSKLWVFR